MSEKTKSQKRREQRKRKLTEVTLEIQNIVVKSAPKVVTPKKPLVLELGDKNG